MFNKPPFGSTGGLFGNAGAGFGALGQQQQQQQSQQLQQPQAGLFGQPSGSNTFIFGGFGSAAPSNTGSGFGAQSSAGTSSLFGQQQHGRPVGTFGGGGGAAAAAGDSGTLFGQPAAITFGQQQQPQQSLQSGGLFGSSFGQAAQQNALIPTSATSSQGGTGLARFQYITEPTPQGADPVANPTTRLQVISAMPIYKEKSLEELRYEDYAVGRKGPAPGAGLFESPSVATAQTNAFGSAFGATTPKPFGLTAAPSNTGLFGAAQLQQPSATSAFGTSSTAGNTAFGTSQPAGAGLFGTANQNNRLFGFGTTTTSTQQPSAFGSVTFGQPATGTASTNVFGGFGTTSSAGTTSTFGTFGTAPQTAPGFGQKPAGFTGFGANTTAPQQQASPFGFNAPATAAQQPTGLFSGFGTAAAPAAPRPAAPAFSFQQPNQPLFGQPAVTTAATNLFGMPLTTSSAALPTFPAFGQPKPAFSSLGVTTTAATNQPSFSLNFMQPQQPASAATQQQSLFGGFGAGSGSNTGSIFSNPATSTAPPSLFGSSSTQQPSLFSGFNAGATNTAPSANAFGGFQSFSTGAQQPSAFQLQPQQQSSSASASDVMAFMKRYPHMSNPLARNVLPFESGINNDYPKKTMELAKDMVRVLHKTYHYDTSGLWPGSPQLNSGGKTAAGDNNDDVFDNLPSTRYYPPPPVRLESVKRRVFNNPSSANSDSGKAPQNGSHNRRSVTLTSPKGSMARRNRQNLITVDPVTMQQAADLNDIAKNSRPSSPASDRARIERALDEQVRKRVENITAEIDERSAVNSKQRSAAAAGSSRETRATRIISPSTSTPAAQIYPTLSTAFNHGEVSAIQRATPLIDVVNGGVGGGSRSNSKRLSYLPPLINGNNNMTPLLSDNDAGDVTNDDQSEKTAVSDALRTAVIVSTRPDYRILPTDLKVDADGRCFVANFTVHRPGFGSIEWPGRTNVAGLNIDELIQIDRKSVTVYGGDLVDIKPAIGEGLNKLAVVRFESVRTSEKQQVAGGIQSRSSPNARKYVNFLRKSVEAMNGTFLEYDWEDDTLTFEVQHF